MDTTTVTERVLPGAAVRYLHLPLLLLVADGAVLWFARHEQHAAVIAVVVAAIGWTFLAERILPYDRQWNVDRADGRRDALYAALNESLTAASVAALPLLAGHFTVADLWPSGLPFIVQVLLALVVLDAGITLAHLASHRLGWLWRFHAVHHSVTRFYGLNGLMKHPIHQAVEMTAGIAPLVLIGIPLPVAVALAGCVAIQLLLQHANVAYATGALASWLAINAGHRLHHLRAPGEGDVNFGLFTLVWDRALGTYAAPDIRPRISGEDIGITDRSDYPTGLAAQLAEPFRRRGA